MLYDAVGYSSFVNPACSPDLIMIDNLFHNMRCELFKHAKEQIIERQAYEEYAARMMETIMDMLKDLIDRTIES